MAIKLISTRDAARLQGVKVLVYGPSGSGKTRLCSTIENPIIISAEAGLLSLRDYDLPVIEVSTIADVMAAYEYLQTEEGQQFDWICLDSVSEIAEVVLANEKRATKDPRQAYGALFDHMAGLIRAFRDLPRHVYMSAKQDRSRDDLSGTMLYGPAMPGQRLGQNISYWFDEVFALRVERDDEGAVVRFLQTQPDLAYQAKDRSGSLEQFMPPDLAQVASIITDQKEQTNEA